MCARFNVTINMRQVAQELQAKIPDLLEPSIRLPDYNISPTRAIAAATQDREREIGVFRWGLLPSWATDPRMGSRLINARAETLEHKPSFRNAFKRRRCLIPASGIYEWTGTKTPRQPWHIYQTSGALLMMAGLWEYHPEFGNTCTIITCDPSSWMSQYHDRMPVFLERETWDTWLNPKTNAAALKPLLKAPGEHLLTANPISSIVNNPRNNRPDVLRPLLI
jgi:putative SOS response-associated peptidase YedK